MAKKTIPLNATVSRAPVKRLYISQSDIPSMSLEKAMRVARAIYDNYGKDPAKPLWVAEAMGMTPSSGTFRMLTGAAVAYGLTEGAYNAVTISLTPLAKRILAPTSEGDDVLAKREATLRPKIISDFLTRYDNSPLPAENIAHNVLVEMGVPRERSAQVLSSIRECAAEAGLLREIKGKTYVDLSGVAISSVGDADIADASESEIESPVTSPTAPAIPSPVQLAAVGLQKVFITHGKNHSFLEPIKKLLSFGGFEAVVAAEKQTVSQPVPEKVMDAMRSCGAAIIHIDAEMKLLDPETKEHLVLNPNVLIEIGAAMALYGRRFILLVKDGVQLPSNLQGLYEVRYKGDTLDSDVTIRLLEAINDIKRHPLPAQI